jgi:PhoPQ-activated pathogenicity-related protein
MKIALKLCAVTLISLMIGTFSVNTSNAKPENALSNYLEREEPDYEWSIRSEKEIGKITLYDLRMVSQKWQGIVWTHQLQVVVPKKLSDNSACLLFVTGGSNKNGEPNWASADNKELELLGKIAEGSGSLVAIVRQTPNQPLYDGKYEDDLISHTFLQYFETNDETWPLLFPMVKTAVKAMDTINALSQKEIERTMDRFVVAGGSKRGWTTWLTGASDKRVIGIGPMVIDTLNMNVQMDYQLECWDAYSLQIEDYTRKGIQKRMDEPEGKRLLQMVDPYSYRDKVTMPKLVFIGTNDPYWPVDAVKKYWEDIPGEKYIHYVPNTGHGLGDGLQAVTALASFFAICAEKKSHPELSWTIENNDKGMKINVKTDSSAKVANLWMTTSTDRDFRNNLWLKRDKKKPNSDVTFEFKYPKKGYIAAYVEVVFPGPLGEDYSKTTRIYVTDTEKVFEK